MLPVIQRATTKPRNQLKLATILPRGPSSSKYQRITSVFSSTHKNLFLIVTLALLVLQGTASSMQSIYTKMMKVILVWIKASVFLSYKFCHCNKHWYPQQILMINMLWVYWFMVTSSNSFASHFCPRFLKMDQLLGESSRQRHIPPSNSTTRRFWDLISDVAIIRTKRNWSSNVVSRSFSKMAYSCEVELIIMFPYFLHRNVKFLPSLFSGKNKELREPAVRINYTWILLQWGSKLSRCPFPRRIPRVTSWMPRAGLHLCE